VPGLVKLLSESAKGMRWYNTQENSYALLALGKFYRTQEKADYTGTISVGNRTRVNFDPKGTSISAADWGGQTVTVKITGKGTAYVNWEASGIPTTPPVLKAESVGMEISREYLDENGQPVALDKVPQGSLVIVKVRMRAIDKPIDNVVMADLLPAGLEIENPRLLTSARPAWIDQKSKPPQYMDVRDDRMLCFQTVFTYPFADTPAFYYATRAVTAGTFVLPPVKAEAMYDPSFRAISDPGKITIVERK
jgi:alpha-2-macroglobulin